MTEQTNEAEATEATEATEVKASGRGRAVMLKDPETGAEVRRADVISELFLAGHKRSEIVKILKEKYGHEVVYQVVFAGTRYLAPAPAAESKAEEASQAE